MAAFANGIGVQLGVTLTIHKSRLEDAATILWALIFMGVIGVYMVYQHIFPNGKRYIGVTRTKVEKRWGHNGYNYKSQLVGRAISKYGWDNIKHEIFCVCETKEQAERVERFLVSYYDTMNPKHGYNVLPGGDVAVNDATPEMRYKLGNGSRGRRHTEEEKQKISEGVKRRFRRPESNGCFGKKASEEAREKMRKAHECIARAVNCYTISGEFIARYRTINEAAQSVGGGGGVVCAISRCCRHLPKYKTAKGYVWEYAD